jgi:hypothetical protein
MFAIDIGRDRLYPVFFVRTDRLGPRLARLTRAMRRMEDPCGKHLELTLQFESLGGRTLQQVMRRASGFRAAMRYAQALSDNQLSR